MTIHCPINFDSLDDERFAQIDRVVMGCAFKIQNLRGRLFDEHIYENDLANRLEQRGFDAPTQIPIVANWNDIEKTWKLDLVANKMVYELKVAAALLAKHEAQALTYAAQLEIDRIKLLNFGETKVVGKLIRTPFRDLDRFDIQFETSLFHSHGASCLQFVDTVRSLLAEIGGFLQGSVYAEFLTRHYSRSHRCERRVPVADGNHGLGTHLVSFYDENKAFYVSSHRSELDKRQLELQRMIDLLPVATWQWINVSGTNATLMTLRKRS